MATEFNSKFTPPESIVTTLNKFDPKEFLEIEAKDNSGKKTGVKRKKDSEVFTFVSKPYSNVHLRMVLTFSFNFFHFSIHLQGKREPTSSKKKKKNLGSFESGELTLLKCTFAEGFDNRLTSCFFSVRLHPN
ncbi:MAG: hypothetical protein NPIRA05_21690 [Nitrospirales bacterium]|nr:MAG: hypothetical protein NPIRA05_21690 [Nitrospirales bacterium]